MSDAVETAVSITVNGKAVEARPGELVIDAAERNGVYIPRFCYHHRMEPVGMCRMCLVEVDTGRGPALQPSCMLTVSPDMVVETASPVAKKAQDGILEFLLINHPLDCPVCDKGGECPLQDHTLSFGPGESRFVEDKRHFEKPISISPNVFLDRERCILCDRCTRFAKDVAGDTLISFIDRGNGTQVNTFPDHPFASYFSGNTVQICPVGALTAKPYRFKARPWDLDIVESTCQSCSVGCRIVVDSSRNEVLRYVGVDSDPVNWSWLCDKGRFGYEAIGSEDRLSAPLVRDESGELVEVRWADALARAAKAIKAGLDKNGPSGIAVIGGANLTNESAYAWAKLAKGVIGTDNVDAQLGDGLPAEVVAGLPRATIDEACAAGGTILVIGSDPKDELPVLFLRLRDAVTRHRATVVELAPRTTSLTEIARHSLRSVPGAVNELVDRIIAGEGDLAVVREALAAGDLTVVLGRGSLAEAADATVAAASSLLAAFPDVKFLSGLRRANVHGALDLGLAPGLLPGRVTLAAGAEWFTEAWGSVPAEPGLDTAGILAAAADGRIDTLILLGADPLADFPDHKLAVKGLEGARTVIAVDTFLNDSSLNADVVLAAATGPAEVDGTTTNLEGRVTSVRQKVTAPGTARPDWMIAAELAFRLGADLGFSDALEIWAEIERVSAAHAGITVEALDEAPDGLLVGRTTPPPAQPETEVDATPDGEDPVAHGEAMAAGTAAAAADDPAAREAEHAVAARAASEAVAADPVATSDESGAEPSQETGTGGTGAEPAAGGRPSVVSFSPPTYAAPSVDAYSLRLVTARRLYDRGTQVSHAPSLAGLAVGGVLTANPVDLERLGVQAGGTVKVTSPQGVLTTPVQPDASVPAGTVVLSWNQGEPSPTALIDAAAPVTEVRVETTS
ncbi:MAG: NADH-quinone oxidoreductase, chain [Acidimicrobiales bacterium]|nr:NADH-quinone oxidoreductase, chain [Acidimicrobiales bacterium]